MTTLDELLVASLERGLRERELVRLLLGYRDGESAADALSRVFPLNEQLGMTLAMSMSVSATALARTKSRR
jgi:hypothetical protein